MSSHPEPSCETSNPGSAHHETVVVWGCGYLGAVEAAALAEENPERHILGVDLDLAKVRALNSGVAPFHEPGLDELLRRGVERGNLGFTTERDQAAGAGVHILCLGTPLDPETDDHDISALLDVTAWIFDRAEAGTVVVGRSTVPPGTANRIASRIRRPGIELAWSPEFLREGTAVDDNLHPDRIVIGGSRVAADAFEALHQRTIADGTPVLRCDLTTAEIVKIAANSFLATKISYINALGAICETHGGDVTRVADALGVDPRIGRRFLDAGLGYGGGCLVKDIEAFSSFSRKAGHTDFAALLDAVQSINERTDDRAAARILSMLETAGVRHQEARVVILGAAFKPGTSDTRASKALALGRVLGAAGLDVVHVDPQARTERVATLGDPYEAVVDADIVVLATEWPEYRNLDPVRVGPRMRTRLAYDARNCWDPQTWQAAGFTWAAAGRGSVT